MNRIDVWRDNLQDAVMIQARCRATDAKVLVVADVTSPWAHTQSGLRGFLDGVTKYHRETLDWLLIGASTKPGHPTTISYECLRATTHYLNESAKETSE